MLTEVPEGWSLTKLGEIAALSGGTTPSKANDAYWAEGTVPWATPSDVTSLPLGQTGIVATEAYVSELAMTQCSLKLNAPNTVLMTSRATIGYAVINDAPMATNQGFLNFTCKKGCYPEFLCLWLNANRETLTAAAGGSTFKELSRGTAKLLPIVLPPLEEQRRIAEVLRATDEAIVKELALLSHYKVAYESTMSTFLESGNDSSNGLPTDKWITGRVKAVRRIPHGWRITRLVEVAKLESGHTPSRTVEAYWRDGDIGWISLHDTKNLERREVQQTTLKITAAGVANSSARMLPQGTVCLSRTATVGKCVIMGKPMTTSQDFANFICSPALNNRYLLHLFRWMGPIWKALSSGSTHKTIYMPTFEALQIVVPPVEAQQSVAAALDSIASAMEISSEHLDSLRELRRSVSSDLLSGRVRVPIAPAVRSETKAVQPAFKRAVFAAEVVHQLHRDDRFGSVKHEKIVHLCELHLGLQDDLARHAYKEAAGPYDPSARRSVERIFRQQKWFDPAKQEKRIVYQPLEACGGHARYFDRYFGDHKAEVQNIIDLLRPLTTQQCEIIATLYAVWNDFLIDGHQPEDDEIVDGVLNNWTDSKRQIPEEKWRAALPWMRQRGLIPAGHGEKTRAATK